MEKERVCKRCNTPKPIGEFALHTPSKGGRRRVCKLCCGRQTKDWQAANRKSGLCGCGRKPLIARKLCKKCTERLNNRQSKFLRRGLCRCGKVPDEGVTCVECRERARVWARELKAEAIAAYGGTCQCPCGCSVYELEFLTLDHEQGGGRKHRESLGAKGSGIAFYSWLKKHGYPKDGLRTMCWNCNCSRGMYGFCPREVQKACKQSTSV